MDHGENVVKYTLSGEGAGSIFTIDQITGDIHALVGLDRSVVFSSHNINEVKSAMKSLEWSDIGI